MLNKYCLLLILPFAALLSHCKNKPKEQAVHKHDPAPADTSIVYNDLSSKVLGRILSSDTNRIKKKFTEPVKITVEEKQEDGGEPYYFYTFTNPGNKVKLFYKPSEGFYIENGLITSDSVTLNKDVKIGMEKVAFMELIEVKNPKFDVFHMVNDDATVQSTFYFKNGKLYSVRLTQTVE